MVQVLQIVLILLRMVVFGLALGMTIISFQSYRQHQTQQLEYAFIGFAFLSMGAALTNVTIQANGNVTLFRIAETIPFIIGFGMFYLSLYR